VAPPGDGLVTASPGRALVAFAADCVPVLLARRDGSAVAACHAGWRGLVAGVVEGTVRALGGEVVAAVGPCAGPERYAVQADVAGPLVARFGGDVAGGGTADLARCAARALHAAGVEDVESAALCTITDAGRFYSHRRDGAPGGRQGAIVFREGRGG
jgi:YfiH family protein